jgi:hypothetical protein
LLHNLKKRDYETEEDRKLTTTLIRRVSVCSNDAFNQSSGEDSPGTLKGDCGAKAQAWQL